VTDIIPVSRRSFLAGSLSAAALPLWAPSALAAPGRPLPIPEQITVADDSATLEARPGTMRFLDGRETATIGFNRPYLGPVLRFRRGRNARMVVKNRLDFPITTHWHGLHVESQLDGGPKIEIAPGKEWRPELPVDQPAGTLWYHSHVHGRTANQVYAGLAGMIIVDDPDAPPSGLPQRYGEDDLPLVLQDRAFGTDGSLYYVKRGPALMHGFRGDTILVNGAVTPTASVPSGLVRLRLLNGSNARIYHLRFADNRAFHQVASDAGLLPAPVAMKTLSLAPAERAEIVVDFADAKPVALLSGPDTNNPMGGMMGGMGSGMMGGFLPGDPPPAAAGSRDFLVLAFAPDKTRKATVTRLPDKLAGAPAPKQDEPVRRRRFSLDMHVGGGGMGRGMMGGGGIMGINGRSFDMNRVDVAMRRCETELWEIIAAEMGHPFHVHGTSFIVKSIDGKPVPYETTGLKDVVFVAGRAEILVRVDHRSNGDIPFMFHCHILEHEDAGMMGQFSVA
jgi:blue copper oxidase